MKVVTCILLSTAVVAIQNVAASSLSMCFSLCSEKQALGCFIECLASRFLHFERRQGRRNGRKFFGPPKRGGPQFGNRKGADTKNNAVARQQDQQDTMANAKAVAGTKQAATGGVGGVDPATGETLFALQPPSAFCTASGQKQGDGTQISTGFCSSIPQGQVPSVDNMVSTLIVEPANLADLAVGAAFNVKLQTQNMQTGFFTPAATEYYTQPQTLNAKGQIKGHQHITIQRLTSLTNAPDPNIKDFFKGVNDAAASDGTLVVPVPAGTLKTPGIYRICTITGSFSHQPVIMPIAQRGAQDDCIRVNVGAVNNGKGNDNGRGNANRGANTTGQGNTSARGNTTGQGRGRRRGKGRENRGNRGGRGRGRRFVKRYSEVREEIEDDQEDRDDGDDSYIL